MEQTIGYGVDEHCKRAAELIKKVCKAPEADVHFLVGGTQTNVTVIDASLKAYQGVLCAATGHINVHETGALEASGHKCIILPSEDGKISAAQVAEYVDEHFRFGADEHMVQPKMVYISNPTELGTIYSKQEMAELYDTCRTRGVYLFVDGARLGYGLMCKDNDLTLPELAASCDVFYIGGTKVGALFGEAVVITNPALQTDFRYNIKQHGGMLAKGRLLGIQFETLFENGLYFEIAEHAMDMAEQIHDGLEEMGISFAVESPTNQIFAVMPDSMIQKLEDKYALEYQNRYDKEHAVMRICTSWATTQENVTAFLQDVKEAFA